MAAHLGVDMDIAPFIGGIITLIVLLLLLSVRMAQEYQRAIVFRLGRYHSTRGPGLYFLIPLVEMKQSVDIRTKTVDIEPQEAITKDSVTIKVDAVLYYKITEPADAIIAVENFKAAVNQAALTTLRNIIGQNELDELLKSRDNINEKIKLILDELSDPWGIKVEMVEIKAVEIYKDQSTTLISHKETISEKKEEKGTESEKDAQKQFEWQTADGKVMEASKVKDLISYFTDLQCEAYIEDKNKEDMADKDPTVRITLKGEKDYSLSVFATDKEKEDNKPAVSSMNPYPFFVTGSTVEKIDDKIKALLNPEEKK